MDVVRRNIEQLRGQIEIQTERGKGCVLSIRLPLTLAIIDGMVVRVGEERYIIPTLSIVMSLRPDATELSSVVGRGEMLRLQGKLLPMYRVGRLFEIPNSVADAMNGIVVVVEDEGRQMGLLIDDILGQQQIVIKSLGETMQDIPGIAGGAIMPDGNVGLILDVGGLVKLAHEHTEGTS
jgi:two-component system chemotaxis sensor kinase CheA